MPSARRAKRQQGWRVKRRSVTALDRRKPLRQLHVTHPLLCPLLSLQSFVNATFPNGDCEYARNTVLVYRWER